MDVTEPTAAPTLADRDGRSGPAPALPVTPPEPEASPRQPPGRRGLARGAAAWRSRLAVMATVGVGGLLGANARYQAGVWALERWGAWFPWGTLLINVAGCFALGFYLTLATERFAGRPATRLFLATGFLGSFTTFSTFSLETVQLAQQGAWASALAYVAASVGLGLLATLLGVAVARAA